jgi:hypothetical protein
MISPDVREAAIFSEHLSKSSITCQHNSMKFPSVPVRLLTLFALLGMLIAPVGAISAGMAVADMSLTVGAVDEMARMAGDMSCCPDEQRVMPDCDTSCPFAIICSTSAPLALLQADWRSASLSWTGHVYGVQNFARLHSFAAEPPARPPNA